MSTYCPTCDSLVGRSGTGARRVASEPCLACQASRGDTDADFLRKVATWLGTVGANQNAPDPARVRAIASRLQVLEKRDTDRRWKVAPDRMGG